MGSRLGDSQFSRLRAGVLQNQQDVVWEEVWHPRKKKNTPGLFVIPWISIGFAFKVNAIG